MRDKCEYVMKWFFMLLCLYHLTAPIPISYQLNDTYNNNNNISQVFLALIIILNFNLIQLIT